jgi:hypothetical protein
VCATAAAVAIHFTIWAKKKQVARQSTKNIKFLSAVVLRF